MEVLRAIENDLSKSTKNWYKMQLFLSGSVQCSYAQRLGICDGRAFIERPALHKCPIENIMLKIRTKDENLPRARTAADAST